MKGACRWRDTLETANDLLVWLRACLVALVLHEIPNAHPLLDRDQRSTPSPAPRPCPSIEATSCFAKTPFRNVCGRAFGSEQEGNLPRMGISLTLHFHG